MLYAALALSSAFTSPTIYSKSVRASIVMNGGKGFGGGEATRDPAPTFIDPNDPKGKQQAIHKAESFAEYLAKRNAAGSVVPSNPTLAPAFAPPPPVAPVRSPPPPMQPVAPAAGSYADYMASRGGSAQPAAPAAPAPFVTPPAAAPPAAAPPAPATSAPPAAPAAPPALTAEARAAIAAQEAAEDAAMPAIAPGSTVTITSDEAWLTGRTGQVKGVDALSGKYHVWLPHAPIGTEASLQRPVLMLIRRKFIQ